MNKLNFNKKIIIGTANFTQRYGMDFVKIDRSEIKQILNFAKKNNINKLDTADTYYESDKFEENKVFFNKIDKKFKFIAKVKPDERWTSLEYCQKKIDEYFGLFNGNKAQGLLFHDVNLLFKSEAKKIFKNLKILKEKNYFQSLGLSIYDPECLNQLVLNYDFDIIQCPYNVLDQRIINSGWYNKLKDKGIEVHVRSIFLQGLLTNESIYKKKYFKKWNKFFLKWFKTLKDNNISPIDYCISDLLDYNFDKIIIGINNYDNLKKIINFKLIKSRDKILKMKINDLKLIDPRNWK